VLKQCSPSSNIFGLPFEVVYGGKSLLCNVHHLVSDLLHSTLDRFQDYGFSKPRFLSYNRFTLMYFDRVGFFTHQPGFYLSQLGLLYCDDCGFYFPITQQLIYLLLAISPAFPYKGLALDLLCGTVNSVPIRYKKLPPHAIAKMIIFQQVGGKMRPQSGQLDQQAAGNLNLLLQQQKSKTTKPLEQIGTVLKPPSVSHDVSYNIPMKGMSVGQFHEEPTSSVVNAGTYCGLPPCKSKPKPMSFGM
jgi:hypothetical protein